MTSLSILLHSEKITVRRLGKQACSNSSINFLQSRHCVFHFLVAEAITNAARHAGASTVDVVVEVDDGRMHVRVSDKFKILLVLMHTMKHRNILILK